jgi:2-dehydro-3-deoxygluconokinase
VLEPVGAGDAFAAGWLSGLLREVPHRQRLRLGHLLASLALTSTADHHGVPGPSWLEAALSPDDGSWERAMTLDWPSAMVSRKLTGNGAGG